MFVLNNITKTDDLRGYKVTSLECPSCKTTETVTIRPPQLFAYNQGALIQEVLADFNADLRERFMSGVCGPCWDKMFSED